MFQKYNIWIDKYKPQYLSDIVGNKNAINEINLWLENINLHKNLSLIITGALGIGKTSIVKLCLENYNYYVKIINPNELKSYRLNEAFTDYYNFVNSIYSKIPFVNAKKNKNIAIIFDDIENITLINEKKYILNIYKENNKLKKIPLIFISNNQHSKILHDLKKSCRKIIFQSPSIDELETLILKILKNENIIIENKKAILSIIENSQYDIRRLIYILEELSYHTQNNILKNNTINNVIDQIQCKTIIVGLFDVTLKLLNNNTSFHDIISYYKNEKVLLPLMMQENYKKKILYKSNNEITHSLNSLINISESLSYGDNIETYIYTDQNWYLQNIHGYYTCYIPSYICSISGSNNIELNNIKFSRDLNKTSLKNINKKNINNISKLLGEKSIKEILLISYLFNHLIQTDQISVIINILEFYSKNISIKDIELCLKIDKIASYNTKLNIEKIKH